MARRAQHRVEDANVPLLGVMGAFVFAAQMINFPVGIGTSGHLVGGALLAYSLGPASASLVMSAILIIQALVFQDGGVLSLGANITNMALLGVLAGYLPLYLFGWRRISIFAGGVLSVLVSAVLALGELLISGVRMPGSVLGISLALFLVSAVLEGAITLAVVQALEAMHPRFIRQPVLRPFGVRVLGGAATLLAAVGVLFASTAPDGIQRLTGYQPGPETVWLRKASAGLGGIVLVYGACLLIGRVAARRRGA